MGSRIQPTTSCSQMGKGSLISIFTYKYTYESSSLTSNNSTTHSMFYSMSLGVSKRTHSLFIKYSMRWDYLQILTVSITVLTALTAVGVLYCAEDWLTKHLARLLLIAISLQLVYYAI